MSMFARLAARAERLTSELSVEAAIAVVATRHGLPVSDVRAPKPQAPRDAQGHFTFAKDKNVTTRARQEATYLAVTVFGRPVRSVARAMSVSPTAVLKAVRAVEDRREETPYDRKLDELELELIS